MIIVLSSKLAAGILFCGTQPLVSGISVETHLGGKSAAGIATQAAEQGSPASASGAKPMPSTNVESAPATRPAGSYLMPPIGSGYDVAHFLSRQSSLPIPAVQRTEPGSSGINAGPAVPKEIVDAFATTSSATHPPIQLTSGGSPTLAVASTPPTQQGQKGISNVFVDTEIRQALADISAQAGITIVADETVTGVISATLKEVTLEQALTVVLSPGNYSWIKLNDFYLVGKAEPTSPNFFRFAVTRTYKPSYLSAERVATLVPTPFAAYVKSSPGELTLTVTAPLAMLESIFGVLNMIDSPQRKLVIEALVTEVNSEVLNQYSFSWLWRQFGIAGDVEGAEFKYTKAAAADLVTLKGLIGDGKAEVRANPRIMAVEGKEAIVEVAQENYFQVITGPANFPYATLQTIKTGISLKVTPIVSQDGEITVVLAPEVSDAVGSGPGGLPINTVRRANTTVRVKDGETIVIGGMSYVSSRNRNGKVPVLGDIPIVGGLFRSSRNEIKKTEVIIMLTPHVVK